MSNFDVLVKAITRLTEKNISVSCNSNLILADDEKAKIKKSRTGSYSDKFSFNR